MGPRRHHTRSRLEKAPELLRARWVPELAQRLGLDLSDALAGDREVLPDLLRGVLAAELLHELPRGPDELVDRLDHVHGDPDRARLVGDGARDRLPDPPGSVG